MSDTQVQFPELDKAVETYVADRAIKNIETVILSEDVSSLSGDLFLKSVLITDETELIHFYQILLATKSYYAPVEYNRISARHIRLYKEYLDKKNSPP